MMIFFCLWSLIFKTHKEVYLYLMQQQQGFGFCAVQERSCTGGNNASEKVADLFPSFNLISAQYLSIFLIKCSSKGDGRLFQSMETRLSMIEQKLYLYLKKENAL